MLAYLFVVLAVAVRFMPHPWMFTPVAGALLYFGARCPKRQLWIPVVALIASDLILTKFVYGLGFSVDVFSSWLWYAAIVWLGTKLRDNSKPIFVLGAALASSITFFIVSNFGVWAVWNMYPKTWGGLLACYAAAVPFFRQAVEGDVLFTAAMFATPVILHVLVEKFAKTPDHTAAA